MNVPRFRALVGLFAAATVCAGCGVSGPRASLAHLTSASRPPATRSSAPAPTAAGNRRATRTEVHRLLTLLPLPAGARRTRPSPALTAPGDASPASGSLVDVTRYWRVPESMSAVWRYYQSHTPRGLRPAGASSSGSDSSTQPTTEGMGWSEPDRPFATSLEVAVNLAPVRGGTVVRVDGLGTWLDPRPPRDTTHGPRLRATLTAGCPRSDEGIVDVRNPGHQRSQLRNALLPSARPTRALICTYYGTNGRRPEKLASSHSLAGAAVTQLTRDVDRLALAHPAGAGWISCPSEDLRNTLLVFGYPAGPDSDLWYHRSGCRYLANGVIRVDGITLHLPAGKH